MSPSPDTNSEGEQDEMKVQSRLAEDPAVEAAIILMRLQADEGRWAESLITEGSCSSRRSSRESETDKLSYTETRSEQTLDSKVDETSHKAVSVCDESVEAG